MKSSLGPQGLDKMLVDEIGDVTITNDGATILRQLEVEHPAARVLVDLAHLQDVEVGDGTTSVVILAAEFLKKANDLIKNKVHPSSIISGFKLSMKEACKFIKDRLSVPVSELGESALVNVAKTSMSSKIIGGESEIFSKLVVQAANFVKGGDNKVTVKSVQIIKSHGQSASESYLFEGYILRTYRVSQQMPLKIDKPKIACIDFNLNKFRLGMGTSIVVDDPKNLEKIRLRECDILKERVEAIISAGANVILTSGALDDIAAKYMVEKGVMGLRRVDKTDLKRIAKATGATVITTLARNDGTEGFDKEYLGEAESVYEDAIGDNDHVFIKIAKKEKNSCATIVVRGANEYMTDEIDRSIHDALCVLKRTFESGRVVPGGGAVEAALCIFLTKFSNQLSSSEQIPIVEFAEALLVIPKVLALNAAQDAVELVSKLKAIHTAQQEDPENPKYANMQYVGLDLLNGKIRNNLKEGVLEPLVSKVKCIRYNPVTKIRHGGSHHHPENRRHDQTRTRPRRNS